MQEMLQNSLTTGQYLLTLLSVHLIQHVDAELKRRAQVRASVRLDNTVHSKVSDSLTENKNSC